MQALLRQETAAKMKKAQEAEERILAKVKERKQKQALHDRQDQQRRIERKRRDESAAQYLLHQKAIAEATRTQDAENHRLVEQQRLAIQTEQEKK
jgi:hypothetical protein